MIPSIFDVYGYLWEIELKNEIKFTVCLLSYTGIRVVNKARAYARLNVRSRFLSNFLYFDLYLKTACVVHNVYM